MDPITYQQLIQYINNGTISPYLNPEEVKKLKAKSQYFLVDNYLLFKKNRLESQNPLKVVKTAEKLKLLQKLHQDIHSAHIGINGTYSRAAERYY